MGSATTIVPVFRPTYLEYTLRSLRRCPTEICLISDGPRHFPIPPDILCIELPNRQGVAAALNAGLAKVSTKYVTFVDQDDLAIPESFAERIRYLDAHPDVGAVMGRVFDVIDAQGNLNLPLSQRLSKRNLPKTLDSNYFRKGGWVPLAPLGCTLFRTESLPLFDERLKVAHDLDLLLRFVDKHQLDTLSIAALIYRAHADNTSVQWKHSYGIPHPRQIAERWLVQQLHGSL